MSRRRDTIISQREDGRGHWPRGQRRNDALPARKMAGLMRRVRRLVDRDPADLTLTRVAIAEAVGVSERSVRRWLSGEDHPAATSLVKLQAWLDSVQG